MGTIFTGHKMKMDWSAIILSGGRNQRFGSEKSEAILEGKTILQEIIEGISPEVEIVVVGPTPNSISRSIGITREDPQYGGPVAGIAAGLKLIESEYVAIIATDMPFAISIIESIVAEISNDFDCFMPIDSDGYRQPLAAIYKTTSLHQAMQELEQLDGASMKSLISNFKIREFDVSSDLLIDIDTKDDLIRARELYRDRANMNANEMRRV